MGKFKRRQKANVDGRQIKVGSLSGGEGQNYLEIPPKILFSYRTELHHNLHPLYFVIYSSFFNATCLVFDIRTLKADICTRVEILSVNLRCTSS